MLLLNGVADEIEHDRHGDSPYSRCDIDRLGVASLGVWKQRRKGWVIPFPLIIVFKIVHYTLIAGRVGTGCQSRANFHTLQATVVAASSGNRNKLSPAFSDWSASNCLLRHSPVVLVHS
jgi:hypothetical protein